MNRQHSIVDPNESSFGNSEPGGRLEPRLLRMLAGVGSFARCAMG